MSIGAGTKIASVEEATVVNTSIQFQKQKSFAEKISKGADNEQGFAAKRLAEIKSQKEVQI